MPVAPRESFQSACRPLVRDPIRTPEHGLVSRLPAPPTAGSAPTFAHGLTCSLNATAAGGSTAPSRSVDDRYEQVRVLLQPVLA